MKVPHPTTIDFETFAIEGRPQYPPVPAGVSIKKWGKKSRYYAWGHLTGNNSTWGEAKAALDEAFANPDGVLCHHAKFDLCVALEFFGIPIPSWDRLHDSLFLLFLDDPNQRLLGLKPAGARLLNLPADERDAVAEWLFRNQPVHGTKITASTDPKSKAPFGAFIPFAPGNIVGTYANGDTDRTEALFKLLYASIVERGMSGAYDRERRLLICLLDVEKQGVPVDVPRLREDIKTYRTWLGRIDTYIVKRLGVTDLAFNLNSGQQVMQALVDAELIEAAVIPRTPTGKYKSDSDAMKLIKDKALGACFVYRAKLSTCLGTFMENWLEVAEQSGGFIYTDWHQTKGSDGGGTRTGRLSSTPNFQNMSKEFEALWNHEAERIADEDERRKFTKAAPSLPAALKGLPALPLVRCYIVPWNKDHVIIDRDFSQQEPRILAHFEDGPLMEQYQANPWIDYHDNAKIHIERVLGRHLIRKDIKTINLGIIYGQGIGSLAEKNGATVEETKEIRDAIYTLYPGLKEMNKEMKALAKAGLPLITWGGRECFCEEPKIVNGKIMTFAYKMTNTLIQGSAGDCTKEAMIRYYESKGPEDKFYMSVHDELVASVPRKSVDRGMEIMRVAMESVEFDVLILSEGDVGENWAELKKYDKKGVRL